MSFAPCSKAALGTEPALERELSTLLRVLRARLGGQLVAVLLGGSFGRGEGAYHWVEGELLPQNDLDVYVVVRRRLSRHRLVALQRELVAQCRVPAIDLLPRVACTLPFLPPSMENVDLCQGHRLLYGPASVIERLPTFSAATLPVWEAENLMRNRLVTLLEGMPRASARRAPLYQSAKAVLASVDARLILMGRYVTSYRLKVEEYSRAAVPPSHLSLARQALSIKLGNAPTGGSPESFFEAATEMYLATLSVLFGGPDHPGGARRLVPDFHRRATSRRRRLRHRVRAWLGRDEPLLVDRLLLALAVTAHDGAPDAKLNRYAARAGVPDANGLEAVPTAIASWYRGKK